ncbi:MAG: CGGC domain-containing protein [Acidobacteria bacterium]|jgi:predicted metal-binding protein|nr:CGGC domain-containing protein [Acidobacteriota bacterium]
MKVGIIICDRYRSCSGGKCFRAARLREGAFSCHPADEPLEIVGFSTCGGCPGGNVEYVPEEMIRNGAQAIHLATGLVVGYPPCPQLDYFVDFIPKRFGVPVVVGTHPVPEKYRRMHRTLASWCLVEAQTRLLATEEVRRAYD